MLSTERADNKCEKCGFEFDLAHKLSELECFTISMVCSNCWNKGDLELSKNYNIFSSFIMKVKNA